MTLRDCPDVLPGAGEGEEEEGVKKAAAAGETGFGLLDYTDS